MSMARAMNIRLGPSFPVGGQSSRCADLLDFLEKQLDIPAFIADADDHPCARLEIIGQKCGVRAAPRVTGDHPAQALLYD